MLKVSHSYTNQSICAIWR